MPYSVTAVMILSNPAPQDWMLMKIVDLKKIVSEVLATLPQPHSENIIDEVFLAIEQNDRLFRIYSECSINLGRAKVNAAGENWIKKELGRTVLRESPAQLSKLIDTYSVLNIKAPAPKKAASTLAGKAKPKTTTAKKRLEIDARKALSDYYMANKASLPPQIALYREEILTLIRAGVPVADAFDRAVAEGTAELSD
jgi:D-mannonate dehydratase